MSQRVASRLEQIDTNQDGRISTDELELAIEQLISEEQKHRNYKCMAFGVVGLLLFVLLANLGLAYGELLIHLLALLYLSALLLSPITPAFFACNMDGLLLSAFCMVYAAVVLLSKELDVQGGILIASDTGLPVEVNSATFSAEDGALRAKGDQDTGVALETSSQAFVHDMSTAYSDDYLAEVKSIRLSWSNGASVVLSVKAFARPGAGNGTSSTSRLSVLTDAGMLTIHESGVIHVDSNVESFLLNTGMSIHILW